MATAAETAGGHVRSEAGPQLASQWRRLIRAATFVAVLTSPIAFVYFREEVGASTGWSIFLTIFVVLFFRGFFDVAVRRWIPWPSLFGTDTPELREEDVMNRRRAWYWRKWVRRAFYIGFLLTIIWFVRGIFWGWTGWFANIGDVKDALVVVSPMLLQYALILPLLFLVNFLILFGPLMIDRKSVV